MALIHSPSLVTNGLVLCLDAANVKSYPGSGTTWTDLSSSQNTGTLVSSPVYDAVTNGGVFTFNGTSHCSLVQDLVPSGSRTITVAFKTNDITNRIGVISCRDGSGGWFITLNRAGSGNFTYSLNNVPTNNDLNAAGFISQTNTWYIITVVHDASINIGTIYSNGTSIASNVLGTILPITSLSSFVAREVNSPSTMNGQIAYALTYNRALTAAEVTQNFNALRGRFGL